MLALKNISDIYQDNIIPFPVRNTNTKTDSLYIKNTARRKPSPADPIKDKNDIKRILDFLKTKNNLRDYCIFVLGFTLGLRASDLLKLRICDIQGKYINVIEKKTKKRNRPMITPFVRDVLNQYLTERNVVSNQEPLFISRQRDANGMPKPISRQQLYNVLKQVEKELELELNISTHTLRKTFAYQLMQEYRFDEEARFTLQSMLNHSDIRTTMIYAGLTQDKQDEMRTRIDNLLC